MILYVIYFTVTALYSYIKYMAIDPHVPIPHLAILVKNCSISHIFNIALLVYTLVH